MEVRSIFVAALSMLGACAPTGSATTGAARFDWFLYEGAPEPATGAEEYRNPILTGFYPDPSITQVGGDYYLVTSTFAYFPGIPVFHSRDLVSWNQIGNVIDRDGMLDFEGLGISRGVFAPTIEHHDGRFIVANTCVDCGGNFIVTATDPAGPWSDPIWVPDVGGIDPSLFFDSDGAVYLMNNDEPPGEALYDGHRAIWIRKIDPETFQPVSEPTVLIDGGVRPEEQPIWIEGPHIYKIGEWYYLSAAEGGTAEGHSQVVLRAKTVLGPYESYSDNPILTQRDLPRDRPSPVTSVGHADLVQDAAGAWWATFLGVRPYEGDFYNTGRETFLLPVDWRDGWPVITRPGETVALVALRPSSKDPQEQTSSNDREEFDGPELAPYWLSPRGPAPSWLALRNGAAELTPQSVGLGDIARPAFLARRQQHSSAAATTRMSFEPTGPGAEAGLAAFQNDEFYYAMGVTLDEQGKRVIRLRKRAGPSKGEQGAIIAEETLGAGGAIELRVRANGPSYDFEFAEADGEWRTLLAGADGRILSTKVAGGFVGVVFGVYAIAAEQ